MTPITRRGIEVLLDTPDRTDYVVSAFADLRVKDGFHSYVDTEVRNAARGLAEALGEAEARKALEPNIEAIREAVRNHDPAAKGLAVFSAQARGLFHVVATDFPVDNKLVVDEEPFVLPLLERWYGEPNYLVAVVDSRHLHLFEAHAGVPEPVGSIDRDVDQDFERDKPRFTYKKRFAKAQHEYLQSLDNDGFLKEVATTIAEHWAGGEFAGVILLGQSHVTAAVRRLLPRDVEAAVVEEANQPMTAKPDDVADDVARVMDRWRAERDGQVLGELRERWKENHLVANGPTDVLDALQQGRAVRVVAGPRRDLAGARCTSCRYRFGAPLATCVYCGARCASTNAVQEILRMALRHRVGVHLFGRNLADDPLAAAGGVVALVRAEANWAPDAETAAASQGGA